MQTMLNPSTGEWEQMTRHQWWLIKLGLDKNAQIDEWTLNILKGPEYAVAYAFGKNKWDHPGANKWLVNKYKEWFPRSPTAKMFCSWAHFITEVYNLEDILPVMEEFHRLKMGILGNSIESIKLQQKLNEKMDAYHARRMKRMQRDST